MDEAERVIVCGVDGSPAGERALQWAIDEASRGNGRVLAVTAWSWDGVEGLATPTTPSDALARARTLLDTAVDKALEGVENAPAVERICERGLPSEALCNAAAGADLMVLGSHGHGAVHDKLVGSTSERAIHHAPCPVVIVPDPRHVERNIKRAKTRQPTREHPVQIV